MRGLRGGWEGFVAKLMLGRRPSYCPGYLHRPPVADQLPPTFAHRSWAEGSTPGCISLAQPARDESSESTPSRVSTVAANLTVVLYIFRVLPR